MGCALRSRRSICLDGRRRGLQETALEGIKCYSFVVEERATKAKARDAQCYRSQRACCNDGDDDGDRQSSRCGVSRVFGRSGTLLCSRGGGVKAAVGRWSEQRRGVVEMLLGVALHGGEGAAKEGQRGRRRRYAGAGRRRHRSRSAHGIRSGGAGAR